jgi:hypothetical protein
MAKQTGPNPFIGRRDNLLGYRMAGGYYVRVISSLTAERVLSDPAFKLTMQYAGLLGKASKIASAIYRLLPQEHGFYRRLTGMAMQLLKQGRTGEEAFEQLYNDFIVPALSVEVPKQKRVSGTQFPGIAFHPQVRAPQKGWVPNSTLYQDKDGSLIYYDNGIRNLQ